MTFDRNKMNRAVSRLALLFVLPLFVLVTGCDDDEGGGMMNENEDPVADFSATPNQLSVSVDGSASTDPDGGDITAYQWEFGNGDTGAGATASTTYSQDGTYTISLTVTDDEGTTASTTQDITVADNVVMLEDDITADRTLSADTTYMLNGLVFVGEPTGSGNPADRPTLTIEQGTVIKALVSRNVTTQVPGSNEQEGASALIVRRSGRIVADGAADEPIIFTSELDDLEDPNDLIDSQFNPRRGLWGGVIVLGRATNNQTNTTENQVEGIPNQDAFYGGSTNDDDSGTIRYVSIRHGGFSITGIPGDEINGLTMGSVGTGTTIEFVEVYANFDDGFEWFGGTVHTNNLAAAFCGDDSFDYDQGFRGTGQFWFSIQDTDQTGRAGEHDGTDNNDSPSYVSTPVISNVTYIGAGEDAGGIGGDGNDRTFAIRDVAAAEYYNSIFSEFPGVAVDIDGAAGQDSRGQFEDGNIVFENNAFFGYGAASGDEAANPTATFAAIINDTFADAYFANNNIVADPEFAGVSRTNDENLDPRPTASGLPATTPKADFENVLMLDLNPIQDVDYHGAFDPSDSAGSWLQGWTALSAENNLAN